MTDEQRILNRWNEIFIGDQSAQPFELYGNESYDYVDEEIEEPTLDEILEIIRNLKRIKTPETDNNNAEFLKAAAPQMTQMQRILEKFYDYNIEINVLFIVLSRLLTLLTDIKIIQILQELKIPNNSV
jgi:hypothetical protein